MKFTFLLNISLFYVHDYCEHVIMKYAFSLNNKKDECPCSKICKFYIYHIIYHCPKFEIVGYLPEVCEFT